MQLSGGSWTIFALAAISTVVLLFWPVPAHTGASFWTFALELDRMYEPQVAAWNAQQANPADRFTNHVITTGALAQRLQSGFLSGTPVPDAAEIEISMAPTFFSGPIDSVGFADLTDVIKREGLDKRMNAPSFSPWTNRGRIFGLPGDVHPVMLAYRADIVEAAGIDVSKIETWEDFARVMKPLMNGPNGKRYLLNVWETDPGSMEMLVLQAGGGYFDANMQPILDSDTNARVLARIVTWTAGPGRIAVNAPSFDANGNYMFLSGQVLGILMPDWLGGVWLKDLPGLSGKMKLMPLPAWDAGGLRTSVSGGSMIGIPKRASFARSWPFIEYLYTNHEVARQLFKTTGIITPMREYWNDPIYNEPNPYFSGQATGRLYIDLADKVPIRTSSPFKPDAEIDMNDALIRLKRYAETNNIFDESALRAQAKRELSIAQADIVRRMASNAFLAQAKP